MNRNSRGVKTQMALVIIGLVAAIGACARSEARTAAGRAAPTRARAAQKPVDTALQIGERDCAIMRSGSRLSGTRDSNLSEARLVSLVRVPVRSMSFRYTWSGWRLELSSEHGSGAIVLVEMPAGPCYIGQGLFFGWTQESLASAYRQHAPRQGPMTAEVQQLD